MFCFRCGLIVPANTYGLQDWRCRRNRTGGIGPPWVPIWGRSDCDSWAKVLRYCPISIFKQSWAEMRQFFGIPKLHSVVRRGNDHNFDPKILFSDVYKSSHLTTINSWKFRKTWLQGGYSLCMHVRKKPAHHKFWFSTSPSERGFPILTLFCTLKYIHLTWQVIYQEVNHCRFP